uniref:Thymosin-repeated protein 2 n=1 Tax=Eriocheir sinensis TaxID=95602 RepID=C3U0D7_ERISI|nr:thymosin-repeated protein 2 [Eriocheir sinensis]
MSSEAPLKDLPKVDSVLKEQLEGFSPDKLKKTDTAEKTALPTKEDIDAEKGQQALCQGIEGFDPSALKKTETQEKNVLPTKEVIEQEKKA